MTKQLLAGLLAFVMLFSLLPTTALAVTAAGTAADGAASDEPNSPYLNREDHNAYIVGDSDGLVHPERNITRAEVATIFYRLLTDETRTRYWTEDNSFPDVSSGDWYNTAISTLANLGVLNGMPDGGFHPNANITRAEFAAVAVRFFENTESYTRDTDAFTDIAGHWANEDINLAYELGIVGGYPDGTYCPGSAITRAEAMTIVNRVLGRSPSVAGMEPVKADMITWPDNMDQSKWYYAAVQEATNSHEYTNGSDGEVWTALLPAPDWTALEKEWAEAASGKTENGGNNTTPPVIPDPQPGESTETTFHDAATGTEVDFGSVALADMTVEPATVAALEGQPYVAYDITPYYDASHTAKYTGSAVVTLPLTEELKNNDLLSGFVVEADGSITYIPGTRVGDFYTFTTPHFSTVGIVDNVVTLYVGQSYPYEDTTGNYQNDVDMTTLDESIATVAVKGGGTTYTTASVTCNTLISSDSANWQATGYYYKADDGNYYPVYAKRTSTSYWIFTVYEYTWGYSQTNSSDDVTPIGSTQTEYGTTSTPDITVYTAVSSGTGTTIIFNGMGPGSTTVTVGGTTYTINVYEQKTVKLAPTGIHTFHGVNGNLNTADMNTNVAKAEKNNDSSDPKLTVTAGTTKGDTKFIAGYTEYTVEVVENTVPVELKIGETATFTNVSATDITPGYRTSVATATLVANTADEADTNVAVMALNANEGVALMALDADTDTASNDTGNGTLTITGVSAGTTTLVAGDTTYDIEVLADGDSSIEGVRYFKVTLYDYDMDAFNQALHQAEVDAALAGEGIGSLTKWNGIYFGNGTTETVTYSTGGEPTYSSTTISNTNNLTNYTNGSYYYKSGDAYIQVTALSASGSGNSRVWSINNGAYTYTGRNLTLYTASNTATITIPYADHNIWTGSLTVENQTTHGNKTYSGIAKDTLDVSGNIQFNYLDGGLFADDNIDVAGRTVYKNVGLPFVYESDTGFYHFNANDYGAYFHTDSEQGTSSTPDSNSNLYYSTTPQSHNFSGQDGRTKGWFPFDDTTNVNTSTANYYFGMKATVPFSMTANGRVNANDNTSEEITFKFSGDDDIWIFIDGQLVLDMGGDRNGMTGVIDFANNAWSIEAMTQTINNVDRPAEDVNGAALEGKLFNDGAGNGVLNQTRETFAAKDTHELTVFYLERGGGSSNCELYFNLPSKDSVSVTKKVEKSIDSLGNEKPLTAEEQERVNRIPFGFTLYKDGNPVANTSYTLWENDKSINTPSTDEFGHFTLQNGQTAKFTGMFNNTDGNSYLVVEDTVSGFGTPTFTYGGDADTITQTQDGSGNSSMTLLVKDAEDEDGHVTFTCENYLVERLPPYVTPYTDTIVLDYGLPVVVQPLDNDMWKGDSLSLVHVGGTPVTEEQAAEDGTTTTVITGYNNDLRYGTVTLNGDGSFTYKLTSQLTGVEVLTYEATVTQEGEDPYTDYGIVYIIPATSMYYEEDFNGLVEFTAGSWDKKGSAKHDHQEPGVVGTPTDSPYGSDEAYRQDDKDSNGTSMYVSTSGGEAKFSYTFTGTGTSFFARTGENAAYMRVVVTDGSGTTKSDIRRNNIYKSVDGTAVGDLYNIPVYTIDGLSYGTYTVTVTLMPEKPLLGRGGDFYLDGIRVMNPLDSTDTNAGTAYSAYSQDGEAKMTVVTLREKLLGEDTIKTEVPVYVQSKDENGNLMFDEETGEPVYLQETDDAGKPVVDDDGNPVYVQAVDENGDKVFKTILEWKEGSGFVLFTDSNGQIHSAEEYKSNGPKEEVYLSKDQSITFSLFDWDVNSNRIFLGIKAPTSSGTVSINGTPLTISNAVDCYFSISDYAQITTDTATGKKIATFKIEAIDGLISLTNIKVTGNTEFTIVQ